MTTLREAARQAQDLLGITEKQLNAMQRRIDMLERENDAIGNTPIRHAISDRLVEIRLLLRDGSLHNKRGPWLERAKEQV